MLIRDGEMFRSSQSASEYFAYLKDYKAICIICQGMVKYQSN
jgi:hypothetical protein